MPTKARWTEAQDIQIKRMRAEGHLWDEIGAVLGMTRWTVLERGRRIGARPPPADFVPPSIDLTRDPLPAGDPLTWGAITKGTVMDGLPYRRPSRPR